MGSGPRGIFISYRRDDASAWAGRLYDRLAGHYGTDAVFIDIDDIAPGDDFRDAIDSTLAKCEVLLVVIGPSWLEASGGDGRRRLDDPSDFVRMEIEGALLDTGTRVVPVLVGGATMPDVGDLPPSMQELGFRQGFDLSVNRFGRDVDLLVQALDRATGDQPVVPPDADGSEPSVPPVGHGAQGSGDRPPWLIPGAVGLIVALVVAVAWGVFSNRGGNGGGGSTSEPPSTDTVTDAEAPADTAAPTDNAPPAAQPSDGLEEAFTRGQEYSIQTRPLEEQGLCLEGAKEGEPIAIEACNDSFQAQRWRVTDFQPSTDSALILNTMAGNVPLCLRSSQEDSGLVTLARCDGGGNDLRWQSHEGVPGYEQLVGLDVAELCLHQNGASPPELRGCEDVDLQHWKFVP